MENTLPDTAKDTDKPTYTLYSPIQIAVGSLLGGPFAACWLLAHNHRAQGEFRTANGYIIGGVMGTIGALLLSYFLPRHIPGAAIPIGYTTGFHGIANQSYGKVIPDHLARGGRIGSWWIVIGVSIISLLAIMVVAVGAIFLAPGQFLSQD